MRQKTESRRDLPVKKVLVAPQPSIFLSIIRDSILHRSSLLSESNATLRKFSPNVAASKWRRKIMKNYSMRGNRTCRIFVITLFYCVSEREALCSIFFACKAHRANRNADESQHILCARGRGNLLQTEL